MGPPTTWDAEPLGAGSGFHAHFGDWERVSAKVKINDDSTVDLFSVLYEWHGNENEVSDADPTFQHRAVDQIAPLVVYSCWHSHSSWPNCGQHPTDTIFANDYAGNGIVWDAHVNLKFVDSRGPAWLYFNGNWGASVKVWTAPGVDPDLVHGPSGPAFHDSWKEYHSIPTPREVFVEPAVFWDFKNATSVSGVSTSVGQPLGVGLTGVASQTGGGLAENFGPAIGVVHLTRAFGTQYPYLDITAAKSVKLQSLSFKHWHNHNPGYPTNPSYSVQVQIDNGAGFADIGQPFTASNETNSTKAEVSLGDLVLSPGTRRIRWYPKGLQHGGTDTTSEYFALSDVTIAASADIDLSWNLKNVTTTGDVSKSTATPALSLVSADLTQTGGGPAENFGSVIGVVHLTRAFGTQYPFIEVTAAASVRLQSLSFKHWHNHNPGYPTNPSYSVQLQVDNGGGFADIGQPITASNETNSTMAVVSLAGLILSPGTHRIRWYPKGFGMAGPTRRRSTLRSPISC